MNFFSGIGVTAPTFDNLAKPHSSASAFWAGGRDRELPLWKETKFALREWLDVRPSP